MDPIVARIRVLLRRYGVTQSELARRSELSEGYLSNLLKGAEKPRHDTIVRILEVLEVTPDEYAAVFHPPEPDPSREEIEAAVRYCADRYEDGGNGITLLDWQWFRHYQNRASRAALDMSKEDYRRGLGEHALVATIRTDSPIYDNVPDAHRKSIFVGRVASFQQVQAMHQLDEWYLQLMEEFKRVPWAWEIWQNPQPPVHTYVDRQQVVLENKSVGILRFDGQLDRPTAFNRFALVEWTPADPATERAMAHLLKDPRYAYTHWDAVAEA